MLRIVYYMTVEEESTPQGGWHYRVTMTRSDLRKFQVHKDVLLKPTDVTVLGDGVRQTYEDALQAVQQLMPTKGSST